MKSLKAFEMKPSESILKSDFQSVKADLIKDHPWIEHYFVTNEPNCIKIQRDKKKLFDFKQRSKQLSLVDFEVYEATEESKRKK